MNNQADPVRHRFIDMLCLIITEVLTVLSAKVLLSDFKNQCKYTTEILCKCTEKFY